LNGTNFFVVVVVVVVIVRGVMFQIVSYLQFEIRLHFTSTRRGFH